MGISGSLFFWRYGVPVRVVVGGISRGHSDHVDADSVQVSSVIWIPHRDAVPVITYGGQLVEPPRELLHVQLTFNSKILKILYRGLGETIYAIKNQFGVPTVGAFLHCD